jgi:hypothetical protein
LQIGRRCSPLAVAFAEMGRLSAARLPLAPPWATASSSPSSLSSLAAEAPALSPAGTDAQIVALAAAWRDALSSGSLQIVGGRIAAALNTYVHVMLCACDCVDVHL